MKEYKELPFDDTIETVPRHRPLYNVGGCADIPTGYWTPGKYGERILNGGLPIFSGFAGHPNSYKTTIATHFELSAMSKLIWAFPTRALNHDSETSSSPNRVDTLGNRYPAFKTDSVTRERIVRLTDKITHTGDEWFTDVKNFALAKTKAKKDYMVELPMLDENNEPIKVMGMSISLLDTITEFQSESDFELLDKNKVGSSGRNIAAARSGLTKASMISEIPRTAGLAEHFFIMTAHITRSMDMGGGPFSAPAEVVLADLKHGDTVKGATKRYSSLTQVLYQTMGLKSLINQTTKGPEYPLDGIDDQTPSRDLQLVAMRTLRNKWGPTGIVIPQVVSQRDGALPSLTEFYYCKQTNFGISGTDRNYHLDLYDSAKLSRTKIRGRLETDPMLERAMNITSEMKQMIEFMPKYREFFCTPKELFDDLKGLGYDWDQILGGTRGWYTYYNDLHPVKFLSTLDLLRMRKGVYKPYWME